MTSSIPPSARSASRSSSDRNEDSRSISSSVRCCDVSFGIVLQFGPSSVPGRRRCALHELLVLVGGRRAEARLPALRSRTPSPVTARITSHDGQTPGDEPESAVARVQHLLRDRCAVCKLRISLSDWPSTHPRADVLAGCRPDAELLLSATDSPTHTGQAMVPPRGCVRVRRELLVLRPETTRREAPPTITAAPRDRTAIFLARSCVLEPFDLGFHGVRIDRARHPLVRRCPALSIRNVLGLAGHAVVHVASIPPGSKASGYAILFLVAYGRGARRASWGRARCRPSRSWGRWRAPGECYEARRLLLARYGTTRSRSSRTPLCCGAVRGRSTCRRTRR